MQISKVEIAASAGLMPYRKSANINLGRVIVLDLVTKRTKTDSSKEVIKANKQLLRMEGLISGKTTFIVAWKWVAPRTRAASY